MAIVHHDRNGCAFQGALRFLGAIHGVAPIAHANAGCSVGATAPEHSSAQQGGWLETSSTTLLERHVVFGGTSRLREQIKNTLKVRQADLYTVVTGCVPEVVGDDVPAMVKEAREQGFPVLGLATPGFKGNGYHGYQTALLALAQQAPGIRGAAAEVPKGGINLLGIVPGLDPFWEGDLRAVSEALASLGVEVKPLVGYGSAVLEWESLPGAQLNVVLSPWGLGAARLLEEQYGTPYVNFGWLPVGADVGLLVEAVGARLGTAPETIAQIRGDGEDRLRYFLHKLSAAYLLHDLQRRVAIVGSTAYALGIARFLAGTLGQWVGTVVLTDTPSEDQREEIEKALRAEAAGPELSLHFLDSSEAIESALIAARPEIILGSSLERPVAQILDVPLVEISAPTSGAPILLRSFAGIDGAVRLAEQFSDALISHGSAGSQRAPVAHAEPKATQTQCLSVGGIA
jgi:nitrogenase molybdenum-iron protein beta chain